MDLVWDTDVPVSGTHFQGYLTTPYSFEETVARLKALSGQDPTAGTDAYKVSVEFSGVIDGRVFTLYDYKGDRQLHIGGHDEAVVAALQHELPALLAQVVPAPYVAQEYYDVDDQEIPEHRWPPQS